MRRSPAGGVRSVRHHTDPAQGCGACAPDLSFPALRPMADIDVLIDAADVERAVRVARDLDYAFADAHASRFAGRMHHLPPATTTQSGFPIALEIHVDTMSPNQADRLTLSTLAGRPQPFRRGSGPAGLALGH